jgi:hypothetical protein
VRLRYHPEAPHVAARDTVCELPLEGERDDR